MQEFYIKRNSELPELRMELINDGRSDFHKFHDAIQNSEITFTMTNIDTNVIKIANAPCYIKLRETEGCVDEYVICYKWNKKDTKDIGRYKGEFNITFGNIKGEGVTYPTGELKMPIREDLIITVLP